MGWGENGCRPPPLFGGELRFSQRGTYFGGGANDNRVETGKEGEERGERREGGEGRKEEETAATADKQEVQR